jgi:hypothetical protein
MFIAVFFQRETKRMSATREKVTTLETSKRREKNAKAETVVAVTATANQNRDAIGSV